MGGWANKMNSSLETSARRRVREARGMFIPSRGEEETIYIICLPEEERELRVAIQKLLDDRDAISDRRESIEAAKSPRGSSFGETR